MKNLVSCVLFAVMAYGSLMAQTERIMPERCGTMLKLANDEAYSNGVIVAEMEAQRYRAFDKQLLNREDEYVIPVVVHVIYHEDFPEQNIPDSLILSQLAVLNEDFSRTNADAANTRSIFDSIAIDTKIRFEFAQLDPQGNPTNGITRTATQNESFDIFTDGQESMKSSSTGGVDAWPTNKYLNLWVCKLTYFGIENALLGFAQFPSTMPENEGGNSNSSAATDGVVINYAHFGRTNDPVTAPNNLGRTCTHEVGHWLGLRHIWADEQDPFTGDPGNCTQDDFVDDTPISNQPSSQTCDLTRNACSNDADYSNNYWLNNPPDMVENYMDYSSDGCMNMFSKGQTERMLSFLLTARKELLGDFTSINEQEQKLVKRLFPNPANEVLVVELNERTQHPEQIKVYNNLGQLIVNKAIPSGQQTIRLNTADLEPGNYFLHFSGQSTASRFVIM